MIRRPPRSTRVRSSAASDVYKRQVSKLSTLSLTHLAFMGTPEQPNQDQFLFRRAAFYSSLKSKVGLIAAKAAALRINMNTDSCLVASRTASRRLASSHATSLLNSVNTGLITSYSPRISRKTKENKLAKQLGSPHSQDTVDGPGRPKSLPQLGMLKAIQKKPATVAHSDKALSVSHTRPGSRQQRPQIYLFAQCFCRAEG